MSKEYPWGKGTPMWVRDAALNDSDKSFTVPTGKAWRMLGIYVSLVTTVTVGNRRLRVDYTDGTNIVGTSAINFNIPAVSAATAFFGVAAPYQVVAYPMSHPINDAVLLAGYTVRVYDSAAIDAAADDLTVVLHYVEYDA